MVLIGDRNEEERVDANDKTGLKRQSHQHGDSNKDWTKGTVNRKRRFK